MRSAGAYETSSEADARSDEIRTHTMEHDTDAEGILAEEVTFPFAKIGEALSMAYMAGAASACAFCELGGHDPEDRDGSFDAILHASRVYSEQENDQDAIVLRMMFTYIDCQDAIAEEKDEADRQKIRDEFAAKGWLPKNGSTS